MIPFITRHVSLGEYGNIELFISIYVFFSFIISFAFEGWLSSNYFKTIKLSIYIKSYLLFVLYLSLLIFLFIFIYDSFLSLTIFIAFTNAILFLVTTLLRLEGKFKYAGAILLFNSVINVITLYLFFILFEPTFQSRIYALVLTYFITLSILIYIIRIKYNHILLANAELAAFKVIFLFCLPLCISMISSWIKGNIDKFYIGSLLSLNDLAIYSLGFQISSVLGVITITINKIIQPSFFYKMSNDLNTKGSIFLVILTIIIGSIFYLFSIDYLFSFIFDDRYLPSMKLLPFFILSFTSSAIVMILNNYLMFHQKTKLIMYQVIISSFFHCIISFYLIHYFSIIGATIAQLISSILSLLITLFFLRKLKYAKLNINCNASL